MPLSIVSSLQTTQRIFQGRFLIPEGPNEGCRRTLLLRAVVIDARPVVAATCGAGRLDGVTLDLASTAEIACPDHLRLRSLELIEKP